MFKKHRKIKDFWWFRNLRFQKKRGQITVFIIIGIMLLLGIALILFMQQSTFQIKQKVNVPKSIVPLYIFVEQCIEDIAKDDMNKMGQNGGFLKFPLAIKEDITSYIAIHPDFPNLKVPLWWHNNENRIPPKEYIEYQLQESMDKRLYECVNNFESLKYFNITELQPLKTEVTFSEANTVYDVIWPLEVKTQEATTDIDRFTITKDIRMKKILQLATDIMNKENEDLFFEEITLDLMELDISIPTTNFELRCSPRIWFQPQIKDKIKRLLQVNVPLVRILNTNHRDVPEEQIYIKNHYIKGIGENDYPNMHATFAYEPSWGFDFNVRPSDGLLLQSGMQKGKDAPNVVDISYLCLQMWHFTYDLQYPIMTTIRDEETRRNDEFFFRFAFPIVIDHNKGKKETYSTTSWDFEHSPLSEEYCALANTPMTISTINKVTGYEVPLANISFECFKYKCNLGQTDWIDGGALAGLNTEVPYCSGAVIKAKADNYKIGKTLIDTQYQSQVEIALTPIKKIYNYSVVKHNIDSQFFKNEIKLKSGERGIFVLKHNDHTTYGFWPEFEGESVPLTLLADKDFEYNLTIYILKDDKFVGGYDGVWKATNIKDAESIIFHAVSLRDMKEEDSPEMQNFFIDLKKNSEKLPAVEVIQ